jgi:hypothetical protein
MSNALAQFHLYQSVRPLGYVVVSFSEGGREVLPLRSHEPDCDWSWKRFATMASWGAETDQSAIHTQVYNFSQFSRSRM